MRKGIPEMRFTRTVRTTAIAAAAVAMVATSALSASADSGFVPDNDDIVVVGSDTTQFALNDLAALYNARLSPARRLASFDATGASPITIRNDNPTTTPIDPVTITRPNGSGAGITELSAPTSATGAAPVDSARSSRLPKATETNLAFLPFAEDQLRWMANDDVTGVPSLTDAQLTGIYNCTITNWSQVGGPNLAIVPLIPQTQSGTRAEWATRVGINSTTPPSCVTDQGNTVQEHDPAPVKATAGSIVVVSVGRYDRLSTEEKAGTILGTVPAADVTEYNRPVFQVVKLVNGEVPAYLADLFGDGSGLSSTGELPFFCEPADAGTSTVEAGEVLADNGLVQLEPGVCGVRVEA